jgi:hypothetical protein
MKKLTSKIISSFLLIIICFNFLTPKEIFANIEIEESGDKVKYPAVCELSIPPEETPKEFENDILKLAKADKFLSQACNFYINGEYTALSITEKTKQILDNTNPLSKCNPLGNCFANCNFQLPDFNINIDISKIVCDILATAIGLPGACSAKEIIEIYQLVQAIQNAIKAFNILANSTTQIVSDTQQVFSNISDFFRLLGIFFEQANNIIQSGILGEIFDEIGKLIQGNTLEANSTSSKIALFFVNLAKLNSQKYIAQKRMELLKGRIYEMSYLLKLNLTKYKRVEKSKINDIFSSIPQIVSSSSEIKDFILTNNLEKYLPASPGIGFFDDIINNLGSQKNSLEEFFASGTDFVYLNNGYIEKLKRDFKIEDYISDIDVILKIISIYISQKSSYEIYSLPPEISPPSPPIYSPQPKKYSPPSTDDFETLRDLLNNFKNALSNLNEKINSLNSNEEMNSEDFVKKWYFTKLRKPFERILEPETSDQMITLSDYIMNLINLFQNPNNKLDENQRASTTLALSQIGENIGTLESDLNGFYAKLGQSLEKDVIEISSSFEGDILKMKEEIETSTLAFQNFQNQFKKEIDYIRKNATDTTTTLDINNQEIVKPLNEALDFLINNINKNLNLSNATSIAFKIDDLGNNLVTVSEDIKNSFGLTLKGYDFVLKSSLEDTFIFITDILNSKGWSQITTAGIIYNRKDNESKEVKGHCAKDCGGYSCCDRVPFTKIKSFSVPSNATSISPLTISFNLTAYDNISVCYGYRGNAYAYIAKNGEQVSETFKVIHNGEMYENKTFTTTIDGWQPGDNIELWIARDALQGPSIWIDTGGWYNSVINDYFEVNGRIKEILGHTSLLDLLGSSINANWKEIYNCSYSHQKLKKMETIQNEDGTKITRDVCQNVNFETPYCHTSARLKPECEGFWQCFLAWGSLYDIASSTKKEILSVTSSSSTLVSKIDNILNQIGNCNQTGAGTTGSLCNLFIKFNVALEENNATTALEDLGNGKFGSTILLLAKVKQPLVDFENKIKEIHNLIGDLANEIQNATFSPTTSEDAKIKENLSDYVNTLDTNLLEAYFDTQEFEKAWQKLEGIKGSVEELGQILKNAEELEANIFPKIEKIQGEIEDFNIGPTSTMSSVQADLNTIRNNLTLFQTNFQMGILTQIHFPPEQQGLMAMWNRKDWPKANSCTTSIPVERDYIQCCLPENFGEGLGTSRTTESGSDFPPPPRANEIITGIRWPDASIPCATYDAFTCGLDGSKVRLFTGCWSQNGQIRYTQIPSNFQVRNIHLSTSGQCDDDEFITYIQWPLCGQACFLGGYVTKSWGTGGICSGNSKCKIPLGIITITIPCNNYNNNKTSCISCGCDFEPDHVECSKIYDSQGNQVTYTSKVCYDKKEMCESLKGRFNSWGCDNINASSTITVQNPDGTEESYTIDVATKKELCPPIIQEMNKIGCNSSDLSGQYCETTTTGNCFTTFDTSCGNEELYNILVRHGIEDKYLKDMGYLISGVKSDLNEIANRSAKVLEVMNLVGIFETIALMYQKVKSTKELMKKIGDEVNELVEAIKGIFSSSPSQGVPTPPPPITLGKAKCISLPPKSKYPSSYDIKTGSFYAPVCRPSSDLQKGIIDNYSKFKSLMRKVIWIKDRNKIINAIAGVENPDTAKINALANTTFEFRNKVIGLYAFSYVLSSLSSGCTCGSHSNLCDWTFCFPNLYDFINFILKGGLPDCDTLLWDTITPGIKDILRTVNKWWYPYDSEKYSDEESYNNFIDEKAEETIESLYGPNNKTCEIIGNFEHFINPNCLVTWFVNYLGRNVTKDTENFIFRDVENIRESEETGGTEENQE